MTKNILGHSLTTSARRVTWHPKLQYFTLSQRRHVPRPLVLSTLPQAAHLFIQSVNELNPTLTSIFWHIGRLESSNFLEVLSAGMGGAGDGYVAVSRDPMEL